MSAATEIQLIAVIVAVACALPGVFLVLRRMAMMSDAISHTVLLGIVLGFFAIGSLESPLLVLAAAGMGVITVSLVELLLRTRLVRQDAAIGLVFPALFSVAVILISRFARGVHLDVDAVLLGELTFAPLDRVDIGGVDLPRSLVVMGLILLINVVVIGLFYKELKLTTFDAGLAAALGFSPALIHYGLMVMVSVTAVGAFDAVGSVLVVALMIAPASAAYLLTDRLSRMLLYSAALAAAGAIGGFWLAWFLDANIAGAIAAVLGVLFLGAFLLAPQRGLAAQATRRAHQRWEFAQTALAIHLLNHEHTPEMSSECRVDHLHYHLRWEPNFASTVVDQAERGGLVWRNNGDLHLTDDGRARARTALVHV
ncbi:Zinc transport system membrane protein TroD [Candidatus Promineifilum breve]|uniref:Zinc transport system membrane protein TroD n=1 Tax=Candidatus Promineifilum breve TaxID=1806508 RepID=A0A160T9C6_9CHLR|nr:metal ABC transporter permease [Candidatus Promineifilum breve]CUS05875.1 Zinc transport system membrane protein TroD [Candidatus Promineifilum breve]